MKFPCLIPKQFCKTEITLSIAQEGLNKYGEPLAPVVIVTTCNYQDKAKTVLTAEKKLIQLSAVAYIPGDITPTLPTISGGTATINGVDRKIFQGCKARNPDGTVNYTEVDLI